MIVLSNCLYAKWNYCDKKKKIMQILENLILSRFFIEAMYIIIPKTYTTKGQAGQLVQV